MPSLGFLKKKKTKDSQEPEANKNAPNPFPRVDSDKEKKSSPVGHKTFHKTSDIFAEPDSADSKGPEASSAPTPAKQDESMGGSDAKTSQQNTPSIQNLVNQPDHTGSQHDSAHSNGSGTDSKQPPPLNIPTGKAQPLRETKGKYTLTDFTFARTLGTGSFGRVHLAQSKHNHRYYAVKVLKKAQVVKMKQVEHTNDERKMLQRCRHPFLVTLWGTWQDSKNLYMVMDFVEGGELFSLLRKSQVRYLMPFSLSAKSPRNLERLTQSITALPQSRGQVLRCRGYPRSGLPTQHGHHLP